MEREDMKIVIVGHVDHGKSSLIGRLFFDTDSLPAEKKREIESICKDQGKDVEFSFVMDHLEEERDQGITIDTTQTFFKTKKRDYVIIDAPGHKEFLKNMMTGASQAEAAILIIDANQGIEEQTRRHAYVLSFLGLNQIIVVINKMDMINYDEEKFNKLKKEISEFLKKIDIIPSYVIPISAKMGDNVARKSDNMKWCNAKTILEALDTFKKQKIPSEKPLRLPVQDVYKIDDKRIIVGRIESGEISVGDRILFVPSRKETEVRSIEVFEKEKRMAEAGECIGITTKDQLFVERGEVISKIDNVQKPVNEFKAQIFWMSNEPFNISNDIILRCSTQEVKCSIREILRKINTSTLEMIDDKNTLRETEAGEVVIRTKNPVVVEKFKDIPELGRFVLVKNNNTIAGGIIDEVLN
ncbi:MAG: GTP-binding protein [Candidatus Aenigmarchaeota archaeon]|nr:GTP-binding protein [Candidatus Aenigmarchaeota archaeon]